MKTVKTVIATVVLGLIGLTSMAQVIQVPAVHAAQNGGGRILRVQGETAANPAIGFFGHHANTFNAAGTPSHLNDGGGGNGIFRPLANTMAFATGSTERMRITSGGGVGIGLQAPQSTLDVLSSFRVSSKEDKRDYVIEAGSRQQIYANNDLVTYGNANVLFVVKSGNKNSYGDFLVSGSSEGNNLFTIKAETGNSGIRTRTPRASLDVVGTDAIIVPTGTKAQRPTGIAGMIRFNTESKKFEGFDGANWSDLN